MLSFLLVSFLLLGSSLTFAKQDVLDNLNNKEDSPRIKGTSNHTRSHVHISSRGIYPCRLEKGAVFQRSRYTFVVVNRDKIGVIGRVKATSNNGFRIKYKLVSKHPHIRINSNNGAIRISYRLKLSAKRPIMTTTFRVSAKAQLPIFYQHRFTGSTTWVRIIIIRRFYGDTILRRFHSKLLVPTKMNHISGKMTAGNLHRLVRMISSKVNPFAAKMSAAQTSVDNACGRIFYAVKKFFKGRYGSVTISASIKDLLSSSMIKNLLRLSKCPKRNINRLFCRNDAPYRSIDGTCNNRRSPTYGSSSSQYTRLLSAKYYDVDGMKDPLGFPHLPNAPDVPNPLHISKEFIIHQHRSLTKRTTVSHFLMQWGQWVDHDLSLGAESEGADECRRASCTSTNCKSPCFPILAYKSSRCIHFSRTAAVCKSNADKLTTREQMNTNTAYIDGSQIYGSTPKIAHALREFSPDTGLLRVRRFWHGDILPDDPTGLMFPNNLCHLSGGCFLSGDVRTSETMPLASMHTLFVREHNRIAKNLCKINPNWPGETIYQETRKIVGAILQKITYDEFLPVLLGYNALPRYSGYKYWKNPGIINSFATAAFRYGHSTIRPFFDVTDEKFRPVGAPIPLKHIFFNNTYINRHGIEPLLFGICANGSEIVDRSIAADLVNHLFERPRSPGLNLIALNIQRGRDHGLPGYNAFRKYCRLSNAKSFKDTSREISSKQSRNILAKLYNDNPSIADLWVAGIAEKPLPGTELGPTFTCIIKEQFIRLRDGDRFFYKKAGIFTRSQLNEIKRSSLSRVLCDNLSSRKDMTMQNNVFRAANYRTRRVSCTRIPGIDLRKWKDLGKRT